MFALPCAAAVAGISLLVLLASFKVLRQNHVVEQYRAELEVLRQDWPGLLQYREDDAVLQRAATSSHIEAVFLGDSITEFWDLSASFPTHHYVNRGIQKQTTPQMLIRFRQDVINLRPKVVVIHAGTNDIAGNTGPATLKMVEDNLQSMAELARINGTTVLLASALPVHDYGELPASRKRSPERLAELNRWIQNYCTTGLCYYVDYWSAMADNRGSLRRELSRDGVHPNSNGYAVMANVVSKVLVQALNTPGKRNQTIDTPAQGLVP